MISFYPQSSLSFINRRGKKSYSLMWTFFVKKCWGGVLHLLYLPKVGGDLWGLYISFECRIWLVVEKEIGPRMSWFFPYLCTEMGKCTYLSSRVFWESSFHGMPADSKVLEHSRVPVRPNTRFGKFWGSQSKTPPLFLRRASAQSL